MKALALKFAEVLVIRAVPGLVNLLSLTIVGERFTTGDFGLYSTTVATATFIGSLILGPVLNGILPEYNRGRGVEEQHQYIGAIIGGVCAIIFASLVVALTLSSFAAVILSAVAFSTMSLLQEILRGQLRNWGYGWVALTQSASLAAATFILVHRSETSLAVWLFGASNALGALLAWSLIGFPLPTFRHMGALRRTFSIGATYTLSTLLEGAYTVGTRYLILWLGTPQLLGIFSFCLDISQRLVGFLVSLASFLVVPRAYKQAQEAGEAAFRRELRVGGFVGGAAAAATLVAVLAARWIGVLPAHVVVLLEPSMFIGVALAITVNRLKKISVDPVVVQADRTSLILFGYLISVPVTLAATAAALALGGQSVVGWILFAGYLLASTASWAGLRRLGAGRAAMRDRAATE